MGASKPLPTRQHGLRTLNVGTAVNFTPAVVDQPLKALGSYLEVKLQPHDPLVEHETLIVACCAAPQVNGPYGQVKRVAMPMKRLKAVWYGG
jgi:hypothetical protein